MSLNSLYLRLQIRYEFEPFTNETSDTYETYDDVTEISKFDELCSLERYLASIT